MSKKITPQPFHAVVDDLVNTFESEYRANPFERGSMSTIFGDENACEQFMGIALADVDDAEAKEQIRTQINNSMENYRFGAASELFSTEGYEHGATPASNASFDHFVPMTILGYHAKTHMSNFFTHITHTKRSLEFHYEFAYAIPTDGGPEDMKIMPRSYRDGSMAGMLDADKVSLLTSNVAGAAHVSKVGDMGFAKLGATGNAIEESGREIRFWALAEDIRVHTIRYDGSVAGNITDPSLYTARIVNINAGVKAGDNQGVEERSIQISVELKLEDDTTVSDFFFVVVNRDTGKYFSTPSSTGRIKDFSFDVKFLDPYNKTESVTHGRKIITARITANPRTTLTQALTRDTVMDEFRTASDGSTDMIKYITDQLSTILANVNDLDQENFLINHINNSVGNEEYLSSFLLAPKLGGFVADEDFDITIRPSGGENIWSYLDTGLKDTVTSIQNHAETDTEFTEVADREWVLIGYKDVVRRFVSTKYSTSTGDNAPATQSRYGFRKEGTYAFEDDLNMGGRTRIVGSSDSRWKNRGGIPDVYQVFGFLRCNNYKEQPSAVYYAHSFKIFKEISANAQVPCVTFQIHDAWDILALCAFRLNVTAPRNAYSKTVTSARTVINE